MGHGLLSGLRIRDLAQIEQVLGWPELRGSVDQAGIDTALCMGWQAKAMAMGIEWPRCRWNGSGWDGGGWNVMEFRMGWGWMECDGIGLRGVERAWNKFDT